MPFQVGHKRSRPRFLTFLAFLTSILATSALDVSWNRLPRLNTELLSTRRRSCDSNRTRETPTPTRGERLDHERHVNVAIDNKAAARAQTANEEAIPLDLKNSNLRCISDDNLSIDYDQIVPQPCLEFKSLDEIHPGLSFKFNSDTSFRDSLRFAIRQEIFQSTPSNANLSNKARSIMLHPNSSLQGSWKRSKSRSIDEKHCQPQNTEETNRLTQLLKNTFGDGSPTGYELLEKIGALCGRDPTFHFIDIVGVQDRKLSHSWHVDTGLSPQNSKTVLWGFPAEDEFKGCGVFSHLVRLQHELHAPAHHAKMKPILFQGTIDEQFIIRPMFAPGKELLIYRDVDVLHSSPDVAYRQSVMRFM